MTWEEALRYIKSAAGHLIVTDRKVVGMALLEAWDALRQPGWVRTADRVPTGADAGVLGNVITTYFYKDEIRAIPLRWQVVAENPEDHEYWLPLPPLPETAGEEGTKTEGEKA